MIVHPRTVPDVIIVGAGRIEAEVTGDVIGHIGWRTKPRGRSSFGRHAFAQDPEQHEQSGRKNAHRGTLARMAIVPSEGHA